MPRAAEMIRHLIAAQEATVRTAQQPPPEFKAAGDPPKVDGPTQQLEVHEKKVWMRRSVLEVRAAVRSRRCRPQCV
jgi:starvation-inducible DNA-binding protein